jgi:short-subunit dehydrogenase
MATAAWSGDMPEQRVALVTGASSGFGKLAAIMLGKKGFRVFGTSRNPGAGGGEGFEIVRLDISSDESVQACVSSIISRVSRIDILVNNAGYVLTGGLEETSTEEAKAIFDTNFFGVVRMTDAILPGMRERKSGQIINVGSLAGTFPVPFEGFYSASKAALLAYSNVLRNELMHLGIKVSIVEPGFFHTNIGNARKEAVKSIKDYGEVRQRVVSRHMQDLERGGDPRVVAELIVKIVESPSPGLRYPVGAEKRALTLGRIVPNSTIESAVRRHWGIERPG